MKDFIQGVVGGMTLGAVIVMIVIANTGLVDRYHALKEECEKDLPRSQVCVMKLVPQGDK